MTLISSSIPNLVNGVSQQPFTLRLSSQGEVQENGLSTVSSGLRKRPPTEHVARLADTAGGSSHIHVISRDAAEKYVVVITDGDLKVYDLAGNEKTVVFTNKAYLNGSGVSFAATTVADYTFITNRAKKTAASTALSPARPNEAMVYVKQGVYGRTYRILINGATAATFTTPDGSEQNLGEGVPKAAEQVATDYIALQLLLGLAANGYTDFGWGVTRRGSVLVIQNSGINFGIAAEDGMGGTTMVAIKDRLQKFTDLPPNPRFNGFVVEIVGDQTSNFDNYWVRFNTSSNDSDGAGVWQETVAPSTPLGLNALTMPHQLIRQADGTFTFGPAAWASRKVGDIDSSPNPSFVGRTINDVFFFQNRLGFLSDENYIQSEAGNYFNVFRTTVTTLLDSDPVDVTAATNKVAVLQYAVPYNERLLLWSEQQQFIVDNAELMTPKRVPIKPTTEFLVNMAARPVVAGRNVYFTTDKGTYSAMREFYARDDNGGNDAIDISSHVPRYIPDGVIRIASGSSEDTIALLSSKERRNLYIYRYYFSNTEKLQSSWSKFILDSDASMRAIEFVGSVLYMVVARAAGLFLEKLDFSLGSTVTGEPYQVLLDRKVILPTSALSLVDGYTVINTATLGYTPSGSTYMTVAHGGTGVKAGQLSSVEIADGVVRIKGDFTKSKLSFGRKYTWRYTLSPLVIRTPAPGGGMKAETQGRTQVRTMSLSYAETGYFRAIVTPEARDPYTYTFGGKLLGTPSAEIGSLSMPTGTWQFPVMSRNTTVKITLESDMPLPVAILSAEWESFYAKRSQSV